MKQFNKNGEYIGKNIELTEVELAKRKRNTMIVNIIYGIVILALFYAYLKSVDWLVGL